MNKTIPVYKLFGFECILIGKCKHHALCLFLNGSTWHDANRFMTMLKNNKMQEKYSSFFTYEELEYILKVRNIDIKNVYNSLYHIEPSNSNIVGYIYTNNAASVLNSL